TYSINLQPNPTLTLVRGRTYTFQVIGNGHPFYIKTAQVIGTGSTYDAGVTHNGAESEVLTFQVPADAPATLFYICSLHVQMTGRLEIVGAAVPAGGTRTAAILALVIAGAAMLLARRRGVAGPGAV